MVEEKESGKEKKKMRRTRRRGNRKKLKIEKIGGMEKQGKIAVSPSVQKKKSAKIETSCTQIYGEM
jgi:hypothetical protein